MSSPTAPRGLRAFVTHLAWLALLAAILLGAWFLAPDVRPPPWKCGFLCFTPREMVEIVVMVIALPLAACSTVIAAAWIGVAQSRGWWPRLDPFSLGTLGSVIGVIGFVAIAAIFLLAAHLSPNF